ncbi:MAG: hypothetical protein LBC89_04350 [Bacteroidales bacterium]|jgi:hypothetical protein|nr:hypothetical protein [Bacteroidales bacterium]
MKKIIRISISILAASLLLLVSCKKEKEKDGLKVEITIEQECETVKAELEDRLCDATTYVIDENKYKKDKFVLFLRDLNYDEVTSSFVNSNMPQNFTVSDRDVKANSIVFYCYNKSGVFLSKMLAYRKTAGNVLMGGQTTTTMHYYYVDGDVSISGNYSGNGVELNLSDLGLGLSGTVTVDYEISFEDCHLVKGWNKVYIIGTITLEVATNKANLSFKTTTAPQSGLSWRYESTSNIDIISLLSQKK